MPKYVQRKTKNPRVTMADSRAFFVLISDEKPQRHHREKGGTGFLREKA